MFSDRQNLLKVFAFSTPADLQGTICISKHYLPGKNVLFNV